MDLPQPVEEIWNNTSQRIWQFIRGRVEDDAAADDLLQEVFLRVHQNMSQLRDQDRLDAWIFQITRRVIIDHYRSRRPAAELSEELPDPIEIFSEQDAAEELAGTMRQMVEALPDPYRQALLMTDFMGASQQELADQLGISLSGAKSRVQRARQKIKDSLLSCCHFELDRYGRVIEYWEQCCCCSDS